MPRISPPTTDDTLSIRGNPTGTDGGHFGNEHDSYAHDKPRRVMVGHADGGVPADPIAVSHAPGEEIPDDAGRRAYADQKTGAVHGSGSAAGGGMAGDDIDQDGPSG